MNKPNHTDVAASITNIFYLHPDIIKLCDKHYILYWESKYVYFSLVRGADRIIREKISYTPVFLDSLTPEWLMKNPDTQVKLSFRRLKHKIGGYVLIKKVSV